MAKTVDLFFHIIRGLRPSTVSHKDCLLCLPLLIWQNLANLATTQDRGLLVKCDLTVLLLVGILRSTSSLENQYRQLSRQQQRRIIHWEIVGVFYGMTWKDDEVFSAVIKTHHFEFNCRIDNEGAVVQIAAAWWQRRLLNAVGLSFSSCWHLSLRSCSILQKETRHGTTSCCH